MSEFAESLIREEQWVPVAESGDRWAPRTKERAMRDMADWPAGSHYLDGGRGDGITHIEQQVRYVTEWRAEEIITHSEVTS